MQLVMPGVLEAVSTAYFFLRKIWIYLANKDADLINSIGLPIFRDIPTSQNYDVIN